VNRQRVKLSLDSRDSEGKLKNLMINGLINKLVVCAVDSKKLDRERGERPFPRGLLDLYDSE